MAFVPSLLAATATASPSLTWDDVLAPHVYVFYVAFIVSFIFTPVLRSVAIHYRIVDKPDKIRKLHSGPVAYLGGIAVFIGWVAGLAMSQLHIPAQEIGTPHLRIKLNLVAGAGLIVLLGFWDDTRRVKPWIKIFGQVCAALLMLSQGVGTQILNPFIFPINLRLQHYFGPTAGIPLEVSTILSSILTVFVVVGFCNATNLLDGLDGLCGGVTGVIAAGFLFLAVHLATLGFNPTLSSVRIVLALALLGAVLGFVPYNFNPASIFMGDAGSMFLGYACAVMVVMLAQEQSKWFLAAMVMFALPILDTSLAIMRRWVNRRPLFSADRHHFHHQLVERGLSIRKTVLISYALAFMFCLLGALIVYMRTRYAIAFYLVIFGSIIVAAYKMGMVHEKPRIVSHQSLESAGAAQAAPVPLESPAVLQLQDPAQSDKSTILGSRSTKAADSSSDVTVLK